MSRIQSDPNSIEHVLNEMEGGCNRDQFDEIQKLHDLIIEKAKNPGPNDFFHMNAKVSWYANAESLFMQKNFRRAGLLCWIIADVYDVISPRLNSDQQIKNAIKAFACTEQPIPQKLLLQFCNRFLENCLFSYPSKIQSLMNYLKKVVKNPVFLDLNSESDSEDEDVVRPLSRAGTETYDSNPATPVYVSSHALTQFSSGSNLDSKKRIIVEQINVMIRAIQEEFSKKRHQSEGMSLAIRFPATMQLFLATRLPDSTKFHENDIIQEIYDLIFQFQKQQFTRQDDFLIAFEDFITLVDFNVKLCFKLLDNDDEFFNFVVCAVKPNAKSMRHADAPISPISRSPICFFWKQPSFEEKYELSLAGKGNGENKKGTFSACLKTWTNTLLKDL